MDNITKVGAGRTAVPIRDIRWGTGRPHLTAVRPEFTGYTYLAVDYENMADYGALDAPDQLPGGSSKAWRDSFDGAWRVSQSHTMREWS